MAKKLIYHSVMSEWWLLIQQQRAPRAAAAEVSWWSSINFSLSPDGMQALPESH